MSKEISQKLLSREDAQLIADYFKNEVNISQREKLVKVLAGETNYLKECPFCGGPARKECRGVGEIGSRQSSEFVSTFQRAIFFVECGDCNCYTREFSSEDAAIEAWNRRDHPANE